MIGLPVLQGQNSWNYLMRMVSPNVYLHAVTEIKFYLMISVHDREKALIAVGSIKKRQ